MRSKGRAPRGKAQHRGSKAIQGVIAVTRKGVGYLEVEGFEQDIEIAPERLATALNRDTVEVKLRGVSRGRTQGRVVKVLERARIQFVCLIRKGRDGFEARPQDPRMYAPIQIQSTERLDGHKALVEMVFWEVGALPQGKVLDVLGPAGVHDVEMRAIVAEQGFTERFPAVVEADAQAIDREREKIFAQEIPRRRDFRNVPTCTIDPVDAKDFDDALSLRELPDGNYEVGVHIADVSNYLRLGSAIDKEAQKRGTSIYLVDRTIPMLPEVLSNDLCSLIPDTDRLTFSAVFTLSPEADVLSEWFGETVIHSDKRFSYEEAQGVLDSGIGPFAKELRIMDALALKLKEKRAAEGNIEFDQDEIKFILDEKGSPIGVRRKERIRTNELIEDFMLLANRKVAEYVSRLAKNLPESERTFIYRIHDIPKEEKIAELSVFLRAVGYELASHKHLSAKEINKLFKQIAGTPEENLIKVATIRSMAKAVYATKNIGHFGLSFRHYTHFTSPIRRYPDVMVHRILRSHLDRHPLSSSELRLYERLAIECSEREIAAVEAERESVRYKQVEYLMGHIGKEFDGVVSGITEWGMYVMENESKAEGLIRMKDLTDDYYVADTKNYRLVGEKKKRVFSLGDPLRVRLVGANLEERTLDFALVEK